MSCVRPLLAVDLGIKGNGKKDIAFLRSGRAAPEVISFYKNEFGSKPFEIRVRDESHLIVADQFLTIPCGKCIECQLAKSREWAARCMLEMKYHDSAYFLTLTYDDDHLVYGGMLDEAASVPAATLLKRDLQLFMKRLRKQYYDQKIRFFACGEYGSKSLRPHYHLILFGLKLPDDDLSFLKMSKAKVGGTYSKIYMSSSISRLWTNGYHAIGDVTFESVAYVARYTTKKLEKQFRIDAGIEPEFIVMSRRPGIAYQYFEEYKGEIYSYDEIFVDKGGKPFKTKPSKYYDRLFDLDNHEAMEAIKKSRKEAAENSSQIEYSATDKSITEYLQTKEAIKIASAEKLRREL